MTIEFARELDKVLILIRDNSGLQEGEFASLLATINMDADKYKDKLIKDGLVKYTGWYEVIGGVNLTREGEDKIFEGGYTKEVCKVIRQNRYLKIAAYGTLLSVVVSILSVILTLIIHYCKK